MLWRRYELYYSIIILKEVYITEFKYSKEKSRGSRITTNTYFTRLQQAQELKFAPLFAPLINL